MPANQPQNLYGYYQSQGQNLPSVQERQGIASQAGIQNYTGSAQQNQVLLGYLQGLPKPPKSPTKPVVVANSDLATKTYNTQKQGFNQLENDISQYQANKPQTYEQQLMGIQGQQDNLFAQYQSDLAKIENGTFPLSKYEKQQISAVQKQFDELKQMQMTANKGYEALQKQAQYREGTNITDPTQFNALNQQAITQDIQKIQTIDNQAIKTVNELRQSFLDKDYEMINNQYSKLSDLLKSKTDTIDKIQTRADKMAADLRDYNLQVEKFNYQKEQDRIAAGQAVPGKSPTGKPDFTAAGFANRSAEAVKILDDIEKRRKGILTTSVFSNRKAYNVLKSKDLQKYEQARENFLRAVLRKESGAVISDEELKGAERQYFVLPGDSKEVILQKQRNRVDALNALIGSSGSAYEGTYFEKPNEYNGVTFDSSGDSYLDQILSGNDDPYSAYINEIYG